VNRIHIFAGVAACLLLTPAAGTRAHSGVAPLVTDRPDFTESALVVPVGSLQLEAGFTWTDLDGSARLFNLPELLLRYGLARRLEVRLGPPEWSVLRGGGARASGWGDTYTGIKYQLGPAAAWDLALIAGANLPTGARALTSSRVDPELQLAWGRGLPGRWSVTGLLGGSWPTDEGTSNFTGLVTVAVARELTSRITTFFEYAGALPERGASAHLLHHGYTYALSPASQVDLHIGFGLSRAAPDFFIGAGYAIRF
jgi:hypothetical protein